MQNNKKETTYSLSNDIIHCSYYVIEYFHAHNKDISRKKLQKFMYLVEALYISLFNKSLFNVVWYARELGPETEELELYYQNFVFSNIILQDDDKKMARKIPEANKILIRTVFKKFSKLETYGYIALTCQENSPWNDLKNQYGVDALKEKYSYIDIDKRATGEWYKNNFFDK